jgi:hypothetical protein
MHSDGDVPARINTALQTMGKSVFKGGFSTLLGVLVLAFSVRFSFPETRAPSALDDLRSFHQVFVPSLSCQIDRFFAVTIR